MGGYSEIAPAAELADCVLSLWEIVLPSLTVPAAVRILPNACIDVVIYASETSRGEGLAVIVAPPHRSYVVGSTMRSFMVRSLGWRHVLGASLRPEGVQPLLGVPAAALGDRVALLHDVIGSAAGTLEDRVLTGPAESALTRLGDVLVERRRHTAAPDETTFRAVQLIRRARGRKPIGSLVTDMNLSPRRLERHFLTHVGMSPKLFSRIVRFDRAVRNLGARGTTSWADFAVAHGYADQAHFINDFRELAGVTPGEMEKESRKSEVRSQK
jgi:AraC-like DNA-binding protein